MGSKDLVRVHTAVCRTWVLHRGIFPVSLYLKTHCLYSSHFELMLTECAFSTFFKTLFWYVTSLTSISCAEKMSKPLLLRNNCISSLLFEERNIKKAIYQVMSYFECEYFCLIVKHTIYHITAIFWRNLV